MCEFLWDVCEAESKRSRIGCLQINRLHATLEEVSIAAWTFHVAQRHTAAIVAYHRYRQSLMCAAAWVASCRRGVLLPLQFLSCKLHPSTVEFLHKAEEAAQTAGKPDTAVGQKQFVYLVDHDVYIREALRDHQQVIKDFVTTPLQWTTIADRRRILGNSQRWRDGVRQLLNGVLVVVRGLQRGRS